MLLGAAGPAGYPGVIRLQFVAAASTTKGQGLFLAFTHTHGAVLNILRCALCVCGWEVGWGTHLQEICVVLCTGSCKTVLESNTREDASSYCSASGYLYIYIYIFIRTASFDRQGLETGSSLSKGHWTVN